MAEIVREVVTLANGEKKVVQRIRPTKADVKLVLELASQGKTNSVLALKCGVSSAVYSGWVTQGHPAFHQEMADAHFTGRTNANEKVASNLYDIACDPLHKQAVQAARAWLTTQARDDGFKGEGGYTTNIQVVNNGPVQLPGTFTTTEISPRLEDDAIDVPAIPYSEAGDVEEQ